MFLYSFPCPNQKKTTVSSGAACLKVCLLDLPSPELQKLIPAQLRPPTQGCGRAQPGGTLPGCTVSALFCRLLKCRQHSLLFPGQQSATEAVCLGSKSFILGLVVVVVVLGGGRRYKREAELTREKKREGMVSV